MKKLLRLDRGKIIMTSLWYDLDRDVCFKLEELDKGRFVVDVNQ